MCCDAVEQIIVLQSRETLAHVLASNRHKKVLLACNVKNGRQNRNRVASELMRNGVVFTDQCFESVRAIPAADVDDTSSVDLLYILRSNWCNEPGLQAAIKACNLIECC